MATGSASVPGEQNLGTWVPGDGKKLEQGVVGTMAACVVVKILLKRSSTNF